MLAFGDDKMTIKKGDTVEVEYEGKLDDGTEFDNSKKHGQPLKFEVGGGQVIKGFDEAVVGMNQGEEKEFRLEPKEAYGDQNPELRKDIPKEQLPKQEMEVGMMLVMKLPDGNQFPAKIVDIGEKTVTIDLNHPLAGKALNFKVKVSKVN